jgi:hypothetical protein
MPSGAKLWGDRSRRGEQPRRLPRRREALQSPLPLAGGWVRVLGAGSAIAGLPMFHTREDVLLCRAIAFQFIRDDHAHTVSEHGCVGIMEQKTGLRAGRGSGITSKLLIF